MPSTAIVTAGSVLTATQFNYLPRGLLAYSSLVTSGVLTTGTHTTFQDASGYSASTTYAANRILRVTIQVSPYPSGGANSVALKLIRGSTDLTTFEMPADALSTANAHSITFTHTFAGPSSSATETFKLQFRAATNNTAVQLYAAATQPGRISVEDLGSQ